jgi:hypothetical protein
VDDPYFSSGGTEAARAAAREEDPFADGGLFGPAERFELLGGQDGGAGDPATDFGLAPLSPSVFDLDPASSRHVLVRTSGPAFVTLYRLDVTTGAIRQIADYPLDADRLMLSDRQGVPRLAMPGSTNVAFPHRPRLERGPGARLRGELATALGLPAGAFDLAPGNFFAHRALPLAFDEKPGVLYFASNLGRDTYGIYSADLEQGVVTDLALEHPKLDLIPRPPDAFVPAGTLVFDRHSRALVGVRLADLRRTTRWLEPALQAAQTRLEQALPGRNVDILEWDRDRRRLLVFSNGSADPGRFHVFDTESARLSEFAQRAPWLDAGPALRQFRFEVAGPGGHDLAAQLTLPQSPRIMPAPIVVVCPANPWDRLPTDFQAETSALARMGFAVLHYAGRGAWGRGVRHREALHAGYADAQLEDLLAVLDEVGRGFNLDTRRVGLVGSGHGGHLALHALSAFPDRFRCAVALEPPIDLAAWLKRDDWETRDPANQLVRSAFGSAEWLRGRNLADAAGRFVKPSLVLSHPGEDGTWRRSTYLAAQAFARRVASTHPESRFQALSHDFAKGLPLAKAEVYGEIEHFLNTHVYNFGVTIGEAVEVD